MQLIYNYFGTVSGFTIIFMILTCSAGISMRSGGRFFELPIRRLKPIQMAVEEARY